jgi:formyltetrahydrofolate-dependent phosphoribosylglycinamide formyltransferase
LLSGGGRTLANLLARIDSGDLPADVVAVVSSNVNTGGVAIAEKAGIPIATIRRGDFGDNRAFSDAVYAAVRPHQPDLIICAGFLKRLVVASEWQGRILNIHPALIPESGAAGSGFYGERVHAAVLASGAEVSGATVHVVDNEYDNGPIVLKASVPVMPGDTTATLAARIFAVECELYPRAIIAHWRTLTLPASP